MVENRDWERLKARAFGSFKVNGRLDAQELSQIINIGCENGHFHDHEKADLINIISNTTRADLDDHMWAKVAELINKFDLEDDKDAVIEDLEDLPEDCMFDQPSLQAF